MIEPSQVKGVVGIVRTSTNVVDGLAHAVDSIAASSAELRLLRSGAGPADADAAAALLARIRATGSYEKGMRLERSAERWVSRAGIDATRNTSINLLLPDGATVRPDFFSPGALDGALFIGEVKNLDVVPLRAQVAHFVDVARANEVPLHLFVPRTSRLTAPLQALVDDGLVRRINLPVRKALAP